MATVTMVRSDYSDKPLSDDDNPVKVKLTVKVGSATGESFDLDFSEDEVEEFLERIRNRKIRGSSSVAPRTTGGAGGKSESQVKVENYGDTIQEVKKWAISQNRFKTAKGDLITESAPRLAEGVWKAYLEEVVQADNMP